MIPLRESALGVTFTVRIQTRFSRTGIRGLLGDGNLATLKVAVAAPPLDGRANKELIEFFARLFGVPLFAVDVISGVCSKNKIVRVQGRELAFIEQQISSALKFCI